ncbi:O-antigen ligase domain-containing protein, partial [Francisella tularensis subsp. holarctica]|nr:O-antigen ligase domain-containing protein [Francisella tularensis subsp. holarctica]
IFSELIELISSFNLSIRYAIALLYIFGVISSVYAISPSIAFKGVSVTFLELFCILFIDVYFRDNSKGVRFFFTFILLSV